MPRRCELCPAEGEFSFFQFPKDADRREQWMSLCGIRYFSAKKPFLCPAHFRPEDVKRFGSKTTLDRDANPLPRIPNKACELSPSGIARGTERSGEKCKKVCVESNRNFTSSPPPLVPFRPRPQQGSASKSVPAVSTRSGTPPAGYTGYAGALRPPWQPASARIHQAVDLSPLSQPSLREPLFSCPPVPEYHDSVAFNPSSAVSPIANKACELLACGYYKCGLPSGIAIRKERSNEKSLAAPENVPSKRGEPAVQVDSCADSKSLREIVKETNSAKTEEGQYQEKLKKLRRIQEENEALIRALDEKDKIIARQREELNHFRRELRNVRQNYRRMSQRQDKTREELQKIRLLSQDEFLRFKKFVTDEVLVKLRMGSDVSGECSDSQIRNLALTEHFLSQKQECE